MKFGCYYVLTSPHHIPFPPLKQLNLVTKRLKRFDNETDHQFGSKDYSQEELIAELGALFLCLENGVSKTTEENSASYLSGWIKKLKEEPKFLFTAASAAQKSVNFIKGA